MYYDNDMQLLHIQFAEITHFKLQETDNVVRKHLLICCGHNEGSKVFGPFIRPVLLTLGLTAFN